MPRSGISDAKSTDTNGEFAHSEVSFDAQNTDFSGDFGVLQFQRAILGLLEVIASSVWVSVRPFFAFG